MIAGCAAAGAPSVGSTRAASTPLPLGLGVAPVVEIEVSQYWRSKGLGRAFEVAVGEEMQERLLSLGLRPNPSARLELRLQLAVADNASDVAPRGRLSLGWRGGPSLLEEQLDRPSTRLRAVELPRWAAARVEEGLARVASRLAALAGEARSGGGAPVVAVPDVVIRGRTTSDEVGAQLADYVGARLHPVLGYHAVPRAELRAALNELKRSSTEPCFDQACQIELGKAVAASRLLAVELLEVGGACALTGTLFDLRREVSEVSATVRTACAPRRLLDGVDALLERLRPRQRGAAPPT